MIIYLLEANPFVKPSDIPNEELNPPPNGSEKKVSIIPPPLLLLPFLLSPLAPLPKKRST